MFTIRVEVENRHFTFNIRLLRGTPVYNVTCNEEEGIIFKMSGNNADGYDIMMKRLVFDSLLDQRLIMNIESLTTIEEAISNRIIQN
jgi:hypothetical protein